jgi:hypothetical protein
MKSESGAAIKPLVVICILVVIFGVLAFAMDKVRSREDPMHAFAGMHAGTHAFTHVAVPACVRVRVRVRAPQASLFGHSPLSIRIRTLFPDP